MFYVHDTWNDVFTSAHADWGRAGDEAKKRDRASAEMHGKPTSDRYDVTDENGVSLRERLKDDAA